jgi:glutathione S-transferase
MIAVHGSPGSPFVARVLMQLQAKGQDYDLRPPAFGAPEWLVLNPIGKMPVLEHDGFVLPESAVIAEYLEEVSPEPSLMPTEPRDRARVRLITRTLDMYGFGVLEFARAAMDPSYSFDEAKFRADVERGLRALDAFVGEDGFAVGGRLSLADCAVAGWLFYARQVIADQGLLAGHPRLAAYLEALAQQPAVQRVWADMDVAFRKFMARFQGQPSQA